MGVFAGCFIIALAFIFVGLSIEKSMASMNTRLASIAQSLKSINIHHTRQVENTVAEQTQNLIDQAKGR